MLDGLTGLTHRAHLQEVAEYHQCHDHRGGFEIRSDGTVVFTPTTLRYRPDHDPPVEVETTRSVHLKSWTWPDLRDVFLAAGFTRAEALGSFDGTPFDAGESSDVIGVLGGWVVAVYSLHYNSSIYLANTAEVLTREGGVASGLYKAAVFGFIISLMGCYHGYNSRGGAQGVGAATTNAVVSAAILILAANYVMTSIFFGGGR